MRLLRSQVLLALGAATTTFLLITGCAGNGMVTGLESAATTAPSPQTSTAGTTGGTSTGGTTTTDATTGATTTGGTTARTRPDTLTGPGPNAQPLFWLHTHPTYFCQVEKTSVPSLVIYDDGNVLSSNGIGAYCDVVPAFKAGWIDPGLARQILDGYFGSPESTVTMTDLPVSDLPFSTLSYAGGSTRRTVDVYGLHFTEDIPQEQRTARAAVDALLDRLDSASAPSTTWVPTQLVVFSTTGEQSPGTTSPKPWPLTNDRRWQGFFAAPTKTCTVVSKSEVARLLTANGSRPAEAAWTFAGKTYSLALGVVLPRWKGCSDS